MKKLFHKILCMLMAFVVLFSTMSFTINMHYCGDSLVDTAIFSQVKTCGMETQKTSDNPFQSSDCSITKKDCCNEKYQRISGQDELQLSFDKLTLDQHIFVAAFLHTYNTLFEITGEVTPSLNHYPPPLIVRHIYKLDETYLI